MKLLLGVSGDDASFRALGRTVDRVRETGDDLTVAVVDRPGADRAPEEVRRAVRDRLDAAGVDAEVRRVGGDAAGRLAELAESGAYDRLVIGGGAESPMGKLDLDHLEQHLVLNCRTSLTIVR